jgi:HNH endonuclease/AP2 domain
MKYIKLTKNKFTVVDDEDYEMLNNRKWMYSSGGYAVRSTHRPGKNPGQELMHRTITNCPKGLHVDHINGNRLDNRKANLRVVDAHFNHVNVALSARNTSGSKGVDYRKDKKKWRARICIRGIQRNLGYFKTKEEAVVARIIAAKQYFGEYARKGAE